MLYACNALHDACFLHSYGPFVAYDPPLSPSLHLPTHRSRRIRSARGDLRISREVRQWLNGSSCLQVRWTCDPTPDYALPRLMPRLELRAGAPLSLAVVPARRPLLVAQRGRGSLVLRGRPRTLTSPALRCVTEPALYPWYDSNHLQRPLPCQVG